MSDLQILFIPIQSTQSQYTIQMLKRIENDNWLNISQKQYLFDYNLINLELAKDLNAVKYISNLPLHNKFCNINFQNYSLTFLRNSKYLWIKSSNKFYH